MTLLELVCVCIVFVFLYRMLVDQSYRNLLISMVIIGVAFIILHLQ